MVNGALSISRMVLSDAGIYQCVAENKYGEVYSNAELKVIGKYLFNCVLLDANWYICFSIIAVLESRPNKPRPRHCRDWRVLKLRPRLVETKT